MLVKLYIGKFRLLRQVSASLPLRTYRECEGARRSNKAFLDTAAGKRSLFVLLLEGLSLAAPQCWAWMHPRVNIQLEALDIQL